MAREMECVTGIWSDARRLALGTEASSIVCRLGALALRLPDTTSATHSLVGILCGEIVLLFVPTFSASLRTPCRQGYDSCWVLLEGA